MTTVCIETTKRLLIAVLVMATISVSSAASIDLPIEPQEMAVGDLDGDGTAEIVVLLIWPRWASASRTTIKAGVMDLEVIPAIKERRELRAFRLEGSHLRSVAPPLPVGFEVLAVAGDAPHGRVVVLLDRGPATLRLERAAADSAQQRLVLDEPLEIIPAMAGAERIFSGYPLMLDLDDDGIEEVIVPTVAGTAIVDEEVGVVEIESPLRQVRSGSVGRMTRTLPRFGDLDGDGTADILEIAGMNRRFDDTWRSTRAAFRKGLGRLRYAEPVIWRLDALIETEGSERRARRERSLWDVCDIDGDGTLEAAVALQRVEADSVGEQMDLIRGEELEVSFHALGWEGSVEEDAETRMSAQGHPWYLEHAAGWLSPFHDLDDDGRMELMTMRVRFGYFGAARALVSGRIKARLVSHLYEWDDEQGVVREVRGALEPSTFKQNLRNFDLSRFRRFPGDIDGDGLIDMVDVSGAEVAISLGRSGPNFLESPDRTLRLQGKVRDFRAVSFFDLDGKGWLDLVAFEPVRADEDDPSEPGRLEVLLLGPAEGDKP